MLGSNLDQDIGYLTDVFCHISRYFKANCDSARRLDYDCFLSNPVQFISHLSSYKYHSTLYSLVFDIVAMEAIRSSETSVEARSTQRHIPEDDILHSRRCESLKSYIALRTLLMGGCVAPELVLTLRRRRKFCPCRKLNPGRPTGSPSLYLLS
jgi:hypothetical protein